MPNEHFIVSIFFVVDEFLKALFKKFPQLWVHFKRGFPCGLNSSEIMTICLLFQYSNHRHFKAFYLYSEKHLKIYFPNLVSYSRFISLKKKILTNIKSHMKNQLIPLFDKLVLRKRSLIETSFGVLKKQFHLEHSRHRSYPHFLVNLFSTLIACCLKRKKPSIRWNKKSFLLAKNGKLKSQNSGY